MQNVPGEDLASRKRSLEGCHFPTADSKSVNVENDWCADTV